MANKPNLSKTLILNISAELFRSKSYSQVSMRDIAKKLDVKASSLYNHISSKDEILEELIFELVEEFMTMMSKTVRKNSNTESKLKEIIKTHIDIAINTPNKFATLNNDWIFLRPLKKKVFLDKRNDYEKSLESIVKEGITKGEIKESNPKIIIYLMLSSLRTIHLWYEKNDVTPEEFKIEILKLILRGFVK